MNILNSYSPVQYSNKLSQSEINPSRCNHFPYNTWEVTPDITSSVRNDYKAEDRKFYWKRDVEMAWPEFFQNANTTPNCVCYIVQETGSKNTLRHHSAKGVLGNLHSKKPRTNAGVVKAISNFNLTSPRISATVKHRTSRKGSHSNPYRRVPGDQKRVYFIHSSNATECRNNSLYRAPILVNAYNAQTELIVHNDEKPRRNEPEALPGGAMELSAVHLCPNYEQNLSKDDIAALTDCPQPTESSKEMFSGFGFKTPERTRSESKYLNLYPRCEFTIIEIEPHKR